MPEIAHPTGDGTVRVEILDRESYRGTEVVQIQTVDDDTSLSDSSGNPPWVRAEEVSSE